MASAHSHVLSLASGLALAFSCCSALAQTPPAAGGACLCPLQGLWRVANHTGTMACTGAASMAMPLPPSKGTGKLEANADCSVIQARGTSEDEADIEMRRQPDCSWTGSVGGSHDGIPMRIDFRWVPETERRIRGDLSSTVLVADMSCRMAREFTLDHGG